MTHPGNLLSQPAKTDAETCTTPQLPRSTSTPSTTSPRTFDLSVILRNRKNSTASTRSKTPTHISISSPAGKDQGRDTVPRRLPSLGSGPFGSPGKLLKRQKNWSSGKGVKEDCLLACTSIPSLPAISSSSSASHVAHPRPAQINRLQIHRRSRSFSELLNNLSSISGTPQTLSTPPRQHENEQPWRSREAWLALHSQRASPNFELPSVDLRHTGAWRQRGRADFFGADMTGPLPAQKAAGRQLLSVRKQSVDSERNGVTMEVPNKAVAATHVMPANAVPALGPALSLRSQRPQGGEKINRPRSSSSSAETDSSDASTIPPTSSPMAWQTPPQYLAGSAEEDDDVLPPLLPPRLDRAGSPSSLGESPVPWAQSGRASPSLSLRLRTPTSVRAVSRSGSVTSPLANDVTPRSWARSSPSSPPTDEAMDGKQVPLTPARSGLRRPPAPRRSTSPRSIALRSEEKRERHDERPRSGSGHFWTGAFSRRKGRVTG